MSFWKRNKCRLEGPARRLLPNKAAAGWRQRTGVSINAADGHKGRRRANAAGARPRPRALARVSASARMRAHAQHAPTLRKHECIFTRI